MSLNIFNALRPIGYTAILADSRGAQIHTDGAKLRQGSYNHFNWGNWRSGGRLTIATNQGNSGDRNDQMLARLQTAINSGAGHLYFIGGVNDVAQAASGYTTANTIGPNQGVAVTLSNVAAVAASMLQYMVQRAIGSGFQRVTINLEPGAENYTAAQIGALAEYQQRQREIAETYPQVVLFDLAKELHDPTLSSTTTLRFKSGYAQEASGSGVHEGQLGGYKVGIAFETFLRANWPAVSFLPSDVNEIPSISLYNQLANPLFVTATGGSLGTGITGTGPGNWTVERNGGGGTQTATVSVQAASDGSPGNEVVITPTFGAAGDTIRLKQDATVGNWAIGDIIQGVCRVTVDSGGTVPLSCVILEVIQNDGTTSNTMTCGTQFNNTALPTDGFTVDLRTDKFAITTKAGSPFLTLRVYAVGSGAGAGPAVRIKQVQLKKRLS